MAGLSMAHMVKDWFLIVIKIFLTLILLVITAGCGYAPPEVPEHLPKPDVMTDILLDIHLVEGAKTGQTIVGDTLLADYYYASVYKKYNINRKILDEAIVFYTEHPKIMEPMYDQIIERLSIMEAESEKAMLERRNQNDAAEIKSGLQSADSLRVVIEKAAKVLGGSSQTTK
jgi:hypothetical protein